MPRMRAILFILSALFIFGCSEKQDDSAADKASVFVSIPPQAGQSTEDASATFRIRSKRWPQRKHSYS